MQTNWVWEMKIHKKFYDWNLDTEWMVAVAHQYKKFQKKHVEMGR